MKNAPFYRRMGFAFRGIHSAWTSERSFRFQIVAALGAFLFLGLFNAPPLWWALFSLTIAGVLSAELLNTSLEHLTDLVHPEVHPAIKVVKDCAAGAVLIFSFASLMVFACFVVETYFSIQ